MRFDCRATVSHPHKMWTLVLAPVVQGRRESNSSLSIIPRPLNKRNIFCGWLMRLSPLNDTEPFGGSPQEAQSIAGDQIN